MKNITPSTRYDNSFGDDENIDISIPIRISGSLLHGRRRTKTSQKRNGTRGSINASIINESSVDIFSEFDNCSLESQHKYRSKYFSDSDNDTLSDDEKGDLNYQRQLFKQYLIGDATINNEHGRDEIYSDCNVQIEQQHVHDQLEYTPKVVQLVISNFDFCIEYLEMIVGDTLEVLLGEDVPLHAEHIIFAVDLSTNQLVFESPLMEVCENRCFLFTVQTSSVLLLSCRVFGEMRCIVTVSQHDYEPSLTKEIRYFCPEDSESEHEEDEVEKHDMNSAFPVIDDIQDQDIHTDSKSPIKVEANHQATILLHCDEEASIASDSDDDERERVLTEAMKNKRKEHVVQVDEFSFVPNDLFCRVGDTVVFILSSKSLALQQVPLDCEAEFEQAIVSNNSREFRHKFPRAGCFEVKNAIYSFVACTVIVSDLPSPTTDRNQSMFQPKVQLPLHGSFPFKSQANMPVFYKSTKQQPCQQQQQQISPQRFVDESDEDSSSRVSTSKRIMASTDYSCILDDDEFITEDSEQEPAELEATQDNAKQEDLLPTSHHLSNRVNLFGSFPLNSEHKKNESFPVISNAPCNTATTATQQAPSKRNLLLSVLKINQTISEATASIKIDTIDREEKEFQDFMSKRHENCVKMLESNQHDTLMIRNHCRRVAVVRLNADDFDT